MTSATHDRPIVCRAALITGATGGIGYHTARTLAHGGSHVIITGRDPDRGQRAVATIRDDVRSDVVTFLPADHSTVGGLYPTRRETPDGYEATLAMNFVGPYVLTFELLPLLRASAPSRCVNVVSAGFKMLKTNPFADVQSAQLFISGDAYAHSKLLNVLASLAWARRLTGDRIAVNVVHPGMCWTQMTQSMTAQSIPSMWLAWPLLRLLQHRGSPAKAGGRVAFVASSSDTSGYTGRYFEGGRDPSPDPPPTSTGIRQGRDQ